MEKRSVYFEQVKENPNASENKDMKIKNFPHLIIKAFEEENKGLLSFFHGIGMKFNEQQLKKLRELTHEVL